VTGDAGTDADVIWTEIDGVPVVHVDEPGPLVASLVFRVGKTDEYLHANGITHIAEHLALFALGQPPHYQNGSVRTSITTFDTTGDAEQVTTFLTGICTALGALDGSRLEAERRVLEVEAQQRGGALTSALYTWRYGAQGPGLWSFEEYAVLGTSIESVQSWADYVFRAENAVLLLSGPPPAGLRLPLRRGPRIPPPRLEPLLPQTPAQFRSGYPQIGALAALPRTVASSAYAELLRRRLVDRLRRDLAVSYSPTVEYDRYDRDLAHLIILADLHPDHVATAASALVDVVDELADQPVLDAEVAEMIAEGRKLREQTPPIGRAYIEAMNLAIGGERKPWDEFQSAFAALQPSDLLELGRAARDGMLYAVPAGAVLDETTIVTAPGSSLEPELEGAALTPSVSAAPGLRLTASPEGVQVTTDGARATVRYATCRATLAWPSGRRVLIGPDATFVTVEPSTWLESGRLVSEIDASTSAVLVAMPAQPDAGPAPAPVPTRAWMARLFLALISLAGGFGMALAATDPTAEDVRAVLFPLAAFFILLGAWLLRGALRDRRRRREAAAAR
jgi:zinc protease